MFGKFVVHSQDIDCAVTRFPEKRAAAQTTLGATMKTRYELHDNAYKKKKLKGETGWSNPQQTAENYRTIQPLLEGHVHSNSELLELGCGAGDLTEKLLTHTEKVTGVDVSSTAIAWAKTKTSTPNFICKNLMNPDALPKNKFDVAVDSCFMHCIIGDDRKIVLDNLHQWLKPDGKFVLYTMCGEPIGALKEGYCEETRCIVLGGIASSPDISSGADFSSQRR